VDERQCATVTNRAAVPAIGVKILSSRAMQYICSELMSAI